MNSIKALFNYKLIISAVISTLIVLSIYLFFLFSDAGLSGAGVKQIYYVDNISATHKKVIDRFNDKFKGSIEVVSIDLPFSKFSTNERKELFARYLRSKSEQIDIFSVDQIWLPRFAKWCEPLDMHLSSAEKEMIVPGALQTCRFGDSLAAVPLFIDIGLMYYRKDIIGQLPDAGRIMQLLDSSVTWDEFMQLGKRFAGDQRPFYTFQADNYEGLMCSFNDMLAGMQRPLYKNDSLFLHSSEARSALTLLSDLVHVHKISPPAVTRFKEMESYEYFMKYDGLFLRGWPSFSRDYEAAKGVSGKMKNIAKAPLPHFRGRAAAATFGGWNLMLSKYSMQKREAVIFIKYLLSEEAQKIMYEEGGYLPSNRGLYDEGAYTQRFPDLLFYQRLFHSGVQRPAHPEYTKMSDIISKYLKQAIVKTLTPQEALSKAQTQISAEGIAVIVQ